MAPRVGGPRPELDIDPLAAARAAVACGDWRQALDLLAEGGPEATSAEALELRANAAYGNGDFEAAVSAWEQLHALLDSRGDHAGAARAAAMVAMYLMMDTGLMAPVRGWLRRAERLLAADPHTDAPARALIAMVRTYERFMCGDMDAAGEQAALAVELGERFGVLPAVVIGRVAAARLALFGGDITGGIEGLDEVGALLMSGEVDPLTTGMMYCELICAAQGLALYDRAREWTDVMERWRHGAAFGGINGRCRVHRAELLRISGPCDAAEEEALAACDELRPWMRREFGWPLAELGNIRLRKGDLAGAEEAFVAAHEHVWSPHPGLALVRLAQDDVDGAAALISDAIAHPLDIPSKERPPAGELRLAPLLDAESQIAAAAGDPQMARRAAEALASIADSFPGPALAATADLADARAALLEGDLDRAIARSTVASAAWSDLQAPFETASARVVLGHALHAGGNVAAARLEWQAARQGFEVFGARLWAERAAALVERADGPPGPAEVDPTSHTAAPSTPAGTFSLDGDVRTIGYRELAVQMHDLKGLRYVARLLAEPGREFHVLDLVAVEQGTLPSAGATDLDGASEAGSGLPMLDDAARDAYRRRLAEVDQDIDDAEQMNDIGRLELARRDREYLIAELTRAVGLGGRHRSTGGTAERARSSVTRSIRYALGRLDEHHPAAAAHLRQSIRTGTYCSYRADPVAELVWRC